MTPPIKDSQDFLFVRTQSLIEHACSTRTDTLIPWGEWGRSVVVMEIPIKPIPTIIIHRTRLLVIKNILGGPGMRYHIHAFDFSRRGSASLPLSDGNDGGIEKVAAFNDGQDCVFDGGGGQHHSWCIQSLSDSIPFSIVRPSSCSLERSS